MNFMGIGIMELAVILLVGFLVLGPGRSIDMARRTGKVIGDLRRTFAEVTDAISTEQSGQGHKDQQSPGPPPGVPTRPDLPGQDGYEQDVPDQDARAGKNPEPPQGGTGSGKV
jgi:Sec-independent protein translocase protein TatA